MSAKNVKTLRAAHESWNKRDFAGVVSDGVEDLAWQTPIGQHRTSHGVPCASARSWLPKQGN
jgi:hypothetical protein